MPDHARARETGTRALLDALLEGDPEQRLVFHDLLAGLGRRTFGMMLFVASLPAFIPIPGVAGAISGPLCALVGVHLLFGMRKPWLPRFIANRGPRRRSLQLFDEMMSPWLARLEHLARPRLTGMLEHPLAAMFTGLQLVLLGLLLALPIPFTNYLFGVLLLVYALALLERDGLLMLLCWLVGIATIVVFGVLSGSLAAAATKWIGGLF
ncbi:MAG: exopolysaccharide biosynthesis protein [Thermomonas sp.]|uniref:exopolysaccharide biosynthesis protein n=1 Tax=Thermomonas sp. TaxID=1971895 RepID=UPI0039E2FAD5